MSLQKQWVIGNAFGWTIGLSVGLIIMSRIEDVSGIKVYPPGESLLLAMVFTVVVVLSQWSFMRSRLSPGWILGSVIGALFGYLIIHMYGFSAGDRVLLAGPIYNDIIGCTGLDVPPKWYPGMTGCYFVFPPVSAVILGLFTAIGQLSMMKFSYRWSIINGIAFFVISVILMLFAVLRIFEINMDLVLVSSILGIIYAFITKKQLMKELQIP